MIVGCGFGGLFAAKTLRRAEVDVTVIDRTNHHLFRPLLYQVAMGILSEGDIAPPIRDVLRHQRNTRDRLTRHHPRRAASACSRTQRVFSHTVGMAKPEKWRAATAETRWFAC